MMHLVLISGLSGSGKSIALNVLEDAGYYCIDNLPANLLPETIRFLSEHGYDKAGISVDARSGESFLELPDLVTELRKQVDLRVIFLESKIETLVRRFSETRRRHTLSSDTRSLREAIVHERDLLGDIAELGQRIDTSDLSTNSLRAWIKDIIALENASFTLLFTSFGFKHGIPLDADLVFDVRCLPNPHWEPRLRPLTGRDAEVAHFLENHFEVNRMFEQVSDFLENWLPQFAADNRSYMTVAIGCTGGQHRSVFFVERLSKHFQHQGVSVLPRHRELS